MKPYIPQPCHEDWNAMSERDKGRHCDVCAKVVVDFTKMSDDKIIDYLQKHSKQKTCGHFSNDQLYQSEKLQINLSAIPNNLSFRKYFAIALLIAFTSFGLVSCKSNSGRTVGEIEVVDSTQTKRVDTIKSDLVEGFVLTVKDSSNDMIGDVCVKEDNIKNHPKPPPPVTGAITFVETKTQISRESDSIEEDIKETKTMGKPALPKK